MTSPYSYGPYPPPPPARPGSGGAWRLVILLLIGGGLAGWIISRAVWNHQNATIGAEPRPVTPRGDLSELEKTNIQIFQQNSPSVVFITTVAQAVNDFTGDTREVPLGTGSGFVWDKAGHIVTNYHVVAGQAGVPVTAQVTLWDHKSYPATVVGVSPDNDLAVVQVDVSADRLRPVLVGTSHDLLVGQQVLAIGDPFGLDQTLTTGIVSALGRTIQSPSNHAISNVIQTDAAINPGNSGGPLLDSAGRLIGVNSAIISPSGSNAGIGFAIPVDTVNRVVPQLIRNGRVVRPRIGIQSSDQFTRFVGSQLGVPGVVVLRVEPNSPAAAAGLRETRRTQAGIIPGDIVQKVDDRDVANSQELDSALENYKPGDTITLTLSRDGAPIKIQVKLSGAGE